MPSAPPTTERPTLPTRAAAPAAHVLRNLAGAGTVFVAIAVFLSVVLNNSFLRTLVFSLCIGLSCLWLIDVGRRLAAKGLLRRHPNDPALRAGWPGWRWMLPIILAGSWGGVQIGYPLAAWLLGIAAPVPGLAATMVHCVLRCRN